MKIAGTRYLGSPVIAALPATLVSRYFVSDSVRVLEIADVPLTCPIKEQSVGTLNQLEIYAPAQFKRVVKCTAY